MTTPSEYNRRRREAIRKFNQQVNSYNRRVDQYNTKLTNAINTHNREVVRHNQAVDRQNQRAISALNQANRSPRYTPREQIVVDRVQSAITTGQRDHDLFLSYARIDGHEVADHLAAALAEHGVDVWQDTVAIEPGRSMALQMDRGLAAAKVGLALLTPAYLTGRFWTQRELGALLHKDILIPVLHGVTFEDVKQYSGILTDLAGFTTAENTIEDIAFKIAEAVRRTR